jgi:metallo-beta-lactamase class B
VTVNGGVNLVGNTRVPAIAEHYARAFKALHAIKADVFVAEHGEVFGLVEKARQAEANPRVNPFVDPSGYQRLVDAAEQAYLKQLAGEHNR